MDGRGKPGHDGSGFLATPYLAFSPPPPRFLRFTAPARLPTVFDHLVDPLGNVAIALHQRVQVMRVESSRFVRVTASRSLRVRRSNATSEELTDAEPDTLLLPFDLDFLTSPAAMKHRTCGVARAHHHLAGLDDLCPQQFHNVRDFRGIKPANSGTREIIPQVTMKSLRRICSAKAVAMMPTGSAIRTRPAKIAGSDELCPGGSPAPRPRSDRAVVTIAHQKARECRASRAVRLLRRDASGSRDKCGAERDDKTPKQRASSL
jgi:hypothetical protein